MFVMSGSAQADEFPYKINNSLRFDGSNDYLTRTFGTPTSSSVFTFSTWVKRSKLGGSFRLFGASTTTYLTFNSSDQLNLTLNGVSAATSTAVFRDVSSHYHVVYLQNGSAQTLYMNGSSVATGTTAAAVFNTAIAHQIGAANTSNYFDGYLSETNFIDGQALDPSYFGETSPTTGQWRPKQYEGTYGNNGFYLPFSDGSSTTTLGYDASNTTGDQYNTNTVLAMHGDSTDSWGGAGTDPYEASNVLKMAMDDVGLTDANGHTVTLNGNVTRSATQSKFGGYSAYFDGNGDYLTLDGSSDFAFGTGDFTIEFWVYLTVNTGSKVLYDSRPQSVQGAYPTITYNGTVMTFAASTSTRITGTTALSAGVWYHVALCRASGVTRLFLDGNQEGSNYTDSANYLIGASRPAIGCNGWAPGDNALDGYIDSLLVTKGVAKYPTNFIPPTASFGPAIPLTFIDQKGKTVTRNGDVTYSTSVKKYGTASIYFDGTGDYLTVPNSSDFDFPGDFTIEAFVYITANASYHAILDARDQSTATSYACGIYYVGGVLRPDFYVAGAANRTGTSTSVALNTWTHIAFVRVGSSISIYVDGVRDSTVISYAGTVDALSGTNVWIGALRDPLYFNGYIDDLRITKGVARYTGNFTPPTSAFPDTSINNWTLTNMVRDGSANDCWSYDTPTNNYCTINPIQSSGGTISNGSLNLAYSAQAVSSFNTRGTIAPPAGKWYYEITMTSGGLGSINVGVKKTTSNTNTAINDGNGWFYYGYSVGANGVKTNTINESYGDKFTSGDVIGVAFDSSTGGIEFFKNGVSQGSAFSNLPTEALAPAFYYDLSNTAQSLVANFGQRPVSSGQYYTEAKGYFRYAPPSGYKALCTANLPAAYTDVIESGSFTGNASADGPFVWCNGTPETLSIDGNSVTWGTHADRLSNGFKVRTAAAGYNDVATNNWTATVLSPESKSAFKNQRAKGNP